jgi:type IV pilus assembly protein PilV
MTMESKQYKMPVGPKAVAGFTLMEVLVTIVILSIGLLGVAGLQLNSLRGNQTALEASVAVTLAMEAVDRVRSNPPDRNQDPSSNNALLLPPRYQFIDAAGTDPGCIDTYCTEDETAQTDAYEWFTRLEELLPGGVGVICQDSTPDDGEGGSSATAWDPMCDRTSETFVVKVAWDHDRDPSTEFMVYRMSFIP